MTARAPERVVSGMRPTGRLHLGHYHGVLRNWLKLQAEYECFFFIADWHALTTHYETPRDITPAVWDLLVEWLACGVDPERAVLFIQSEVPEHAELALLLGMLTPLSWLERVPTFKEQQEKLKERELATYGFLGYPLLMSADVLAYRARHVPVGADQLAHIEINREIARRFNWLYGRGADWQSRTEAGLAAMGKKAARAYEALRVRYQQEGDLGAVAEAQELLGAQASLGEGTKHLLLAHLEGKGDEILPEPQALLTEAARMPGLDGQKMSKSYGNTIGLREPEDEVRRKMRTMPTDPARVRRIDPGNPERCPVWEFHKVYSSADTRAWVWEGCTTAGIGCLECKQPVIDAVLIEQAPIRERAEAWVAQPGRLREIVVEGGRRARAVAGETLTLVRESMGLAHGRGGSA